MGLLYTLLTLHYRYHLAYSTEKKKNPSPIFKPQTFKVMYEELPGGKKHTTNKPTKKPSGNLAYSYFPLTQKQS